MTPAAARRHYLAQRTLAARTATSARALWGRVDAGDLDGSHRQIADRLFVLVSTAQLAAASAADDYTDTVLGQQDIVAAAEGAVNPSAFAGVASDGRSLEMLLYEPVIAAKVAVGRGRDLPNSLASGAATLTRIVGTQVADAGRQAVGVAVAARPRVGWVRQLSPPSCSRCAVLAGKFFRFNDGFQRHPLCDCVHIPTSENVAGDLTTDPKAYFDSLGKEDQDRYFTKAGAEAIRDGADIGQVVNARRGMSTTVTKSGRKVLTRRDGVFSTTAGARRGQVRLMPESIYEVAKDRTDAIRLLKVNGYLT